MPCGHIINDHTSASAAALGKMRSPTLLVPGQGTHLGLLITNRPRSTVQRTLVELHALPGALSPRRGWVGKERATKPSVSAEYATKMRKIPPSTPTGGGKQADDGPSHIKADTLATLSLHLSDDVGDGRRQAYE